MSRATTTRAGSSVGRGHGYTGQSLHVTCLPEPNTGAMAQFWSSSGLLLTVGRDDDSPITHDLHHIRARVATRLYTCFVRMHTTPYYDHDRTGARTHTTGPSGLVAGLLALADPVAVTRVHKKVGTVQCLLGRVVSWTDRPDDRDTTQHVHPTNAPAARLCMVATPRR
jgi:hypothetical protein